MLRPVNIMQAAEADLKRKTRNLAEADFEDPHYEQYAFHRGHVRRAKSPHDLLILALMDPHAADKTAKANTRMIYADTELLLAAVRS